MPRIRESRRVPVRLFDLLSGSDTPAKSAHYDLPQDAGPNALCNAERNRYIVRFGVNAERAKQPLKRALHSTSRASIA
jgi:hypothetical protein